MRRSSPDSAKRRGRKPALEALETRIPVAEGVGPFLALSALSAVARSHAAPSAPQLDNTPGRRALQQENTTHAVGLTPTQQVALVPPMTAAAPKPAPPTLPGLADWEPAWLDDLATNLGDFLGAPRRQGGSGFAGGGSAALPESGGLGLAPPSAGDFRPETNAPAPPRSADHDPGADLAFLAGLDAPVSAAGSAATAGPVRRVVTWATPQGWQFQHSHRTLGRSSGELRLVRGPAAAPLGAGSLRLAVGADGNSFEAFRSTRYHGARLNQLTALSYSTYVEQYGAGAGRRAPYLNLLVDTNNDGVIDDQLFFEPAYQSATAVVTGTWQTWDALRGRWWSQNGVAGATPSVAGVKTLAQYLAARPNARIVNGVGEAWGRGTGGLRLAAGWGPAQGANFRGYADNVTVGVNGQGTTTFDMENSEEIYSNSEPPFGDLGDPQDTGGGATGVYLHNGEFHTRVVDLEIPGRGFNWRFERSYRSDVQFDTVLGHNWDFADNRRLRLVTGTNQAELQKSFPPDVVVEPNDVVRLDGRNRADLYKLDPATGNYTAPAGFFTSLAVVGGFFVERDQSGMAWTYTQPGEQDVFRITRIEDRNGNRMSYLYDAGFSRLDKVVDTLGRVIQYGYNEEGRLQSVTDFMGRQLVFTYSAQGDLETVRSPVVSGTPNGNNFPDGKTTRYGYSSGLPDERLNHDLLTVTAPNEVATGVQSPPARLTLTYETNTASPDVGRVRTQHLGGTNASGVEAGGTITYAYEALAKVIDDGDNGFNANGFSPPANGGYQGDNRSAPVGGGSNATWTFPVTPGQKYKVAANWVASANNASNAPFKVWDGGLLLNTVLANQKNAAADFQDAGGTWKNLGGPYTPNTNTLVVELTNVNVNGPVNADAVRVQRVPDVTDAQPAWLRTTVIDRKGTVVPAQGNMTEYQTNQRGNLVQTKEFTRGLRQNQPAFFRTSAAYDADYRLLGRTLPEGNGVGYQFDSANADRLQQGNLLATTRTPDGVRGGDQTSIQTTFTYEPLFNQVRTETDPRGTDPNYRPAIRLTGEPYPNPARYTTTYTFDYQEGTDYEGLAGKLGLTAADVQALLVAADIPMGLGDVNGDGVTNQVNGNVVRVKHPDVNLLPGSNEAAIESERQGEPTTVQPVVELMQYNGFGQRTRHADPDGNVDLVAYYPENDPDGDGTQTPAPPDGRTLDSVTGGYLRQGTQDAGAAGVTANIRRLYQYDQVGNVTREIDGRGIATDYVVNQLNQVVQTVRAAAHLQPPNFTPDPPEPLALLDFQYLERTFYDFNDNVVLRQVEDRNNTSNVDGNLLAADLPAGVPGATNPDPAGGPAFVDTALKYDLLDRLLETVQEVKNGPAPADLVFLRTRQRYDRNENLVLTLQPAGNASSAVYDERDLLFQSIRGTATRPPEGLYATGDPITFNRPGGTGTAASTFTYNYDKNRNQIEAVDALLSAGGTPSLIAGAGDVTRTAYDGFDRPRTVTDPLGNASATSYDPASNVIRVRQDGEAVNDGPGGTNQTLAATEYVHDELSRVFVSHRVLFPTTYPAGQGPQRPPALADNAAMDALAAYLPTAANGPGGDTDPVPGAVGIAVLGRISTITEYDRNSRLTFTVTDDQDTSQTAYDGANRAVLTVDGAGNSVQTAYDDDSNVIERVETDVTTVSVNLVEGFVTTSFYDALNRLQTAVDHRGQADDYRYDSRDHLVAHADAVGPLTDGQGNQRLLNRRGLGGSGPVAVNFFGNVTRSYYDGLGRLVESETLLTQSGKGDGAFVGADESGSKQDPSTFVYPGQAADGKINTSYAYDADSQLLARRDDNGNTTAYIYDNQGRLLTERKGLNAGYQGTAFTIAGGDTTGAFSVGLRGGFAPVDTEPNGTDTAFTYDLDSNALTVQNEGDVNGVRSTLTSGYDALDRRKTLTVTNPAGSAFVGTTSQTWQYDGLSRQTVSTDNNGVAANLVTDTAFYDSLSRLVEEQQQVGATARAVSYNYQVAAGAVGRASALFFPDGRRLDSNYDGLDRLVARQDNGQATAIGTYQYIGPSRVAVLTYQNKTRLTHVSQAGTTYTDSGFDSLRRVVNHRWEGFPTGQALGAGALVVGFGHRDGAPVPQPAYDRANHKLIEEKLHDLGNSEVYTYQSDYQLLTFNRGTLNPAKTAIATATQTSGALQSQSWELDGLGNWRTNTHATYQGTAGTEARTATDFNEIGTVSAVVGVPYGGGVTGPHALDKDGNLLDDGVRTYQWDALNRLRRVSRKSDNALLAEYAYDAGNRRVRKVVSNGGLDGTATNGTTDFYYDGWRVVEERSPALGDRVERQYVYGNYLDEVWALDDRYNEGTGQVVPVSALNDGVGGERLFVHANTLYSVHGLTDEAGALKEAYQYDAYGRQTVIRPATPGGTVHFDGTDVRVVGGASAWNNPYLYTGQRLDAETKLDYYKERYYGPDLGRFIQRDPSGFTGRDDNLYRYAFNQPIHSTDPFGLDAIYLVDTKLETAFGKGHCAVLIGNDKTGWTYYSFSPKHWKLISEGELTVKSYDSLQDAKQDKALNRYSHYARWETGRADDEKARDVAKSYKGVRWHATDNNCVNLVDSAMRAAGIRLKVEMGKFPNPVGWFQGIVDDISSSISGMQAKSSFVEYPSPGDTYDKNAPGAKEKGKWK